jgi:hypothetical protein
VCRFAICLSTKFDRLGDLNPADPRFGAIVGLFFRNLQEQEPPSGTDGAHEASYTNKGYGATDIVGQRCQTELAPDIFNATREKVPLPHPFENGSAKVSHGSGVIISLRAM